MATTDPLLIDFDAFRAEQQARPLIIRIGGQDYALPVESAGVGRARRDPPRPAAARRPCRPTRSRGLAEGLFGTAVLDELIRVHRLTVAELQALITPGHGHLRRRGQPTPKPGEPADAAPDPFDLMESWALVEADFMREYGIDLVTDLPRLTLRRFMVLVRGLGPGSAVANRQAARHYLRRRGVADGADAGRVGGSPRRLLRPSAWPGELAVASGSRSARCTRRSRSTRASSRPTSRARRACSAASPTSPRASALRHRRGARWRRPPAVDRRYGIASIGNAPGPGAGLGPGGRACSATSGDAVNRWAEQSSRRARGHRRPARDERRQLRRVGQERGRLDRRRPRRRPRRWPCGRARSALATGKSYDEVFGALQKGAAGVAQGPQGVRRRDRHERRQAAGPRRWACGTARGALDASAAAQARSALILAADDRLPGAGGRHDRHPRRQPAQVRRRRRRGPGHGRRRVHERRRGGPAGLPRRLHRGVRLGHLGHPDRPGDARRGSSTVAARRRWPSSPTRSSRPSGP